VSVSKIIKTGPQVVAPYPGVINIREALMDGLSGRAPSLYPCLPATCCRLFARRLSTCTTYQLQWRLGNTVVPLAVVGCSSTTVSMASLCGTVSGRTLPAKRVATHSAPTPS
jgi:hypothetical protein